MRGLCVCRDFKYNCLTMKLKVERNFFELLDNINSECAFRIENLLSITEKINLE